MPREARPRDTPAMNGWCWPAPAPWAKTNTARGVPATGYACAPSRVSSVATIPSSPSRSVRSVTLVQVHRLRLLPHAQINHLDKDREAHRKVDVALRDVLVETLADQRRTDEKQAAKSQHIPRRTASDEAS